MSRIAEVQIVRYCDFCSQKNLGGNSCQICGKDTCAFHSFIIPFRKNFTTPRTVAMEEEEQLKPFARQNLLVLSLTHLMHVICAECASNNSLVRTIEMIRRSQVS
jgi:hypothetical protein